MSASDQPMEMQAEVSFIIDRNQGLNARFTTTFVITDVDDAEARGTQMRDSVNAFIEGYGAEAE